MQIRGKKYFSVLNSHWNKDISLQGEPESTIEFSLCVKLQHKQKNIEAVRL